MSKLEVKSEQELTDIEKEIINNLKSKQENGLMSGKEEILVK